MTEELDPAHHIFRYVGGGSIDGDFIDPAAFRRKVKDGHLEMGLSVNWVEWFNKSTPKEAVRPLAEVFTKKNFKIGATARFALLNVAQAKEASLRWAEVSIVQDERPDDLSHAQITNYDALVNDQIAEQLQKVIIATFPAKAV